MRNTKTKSTLVMLAVSMLLCIAMLAGTTFAWFTDSASTGVNKIQAGNLDIAIVDAQGNPVSNLEWVAKDGRARDAILWEPGATYTLTPFAIKNTGSLALKYKFVIAGIVGDAKLLEAIDFTYTTPADTATTAASQAFDIDAEHELAAGAATDLITITGHMKEEAGNEYQSLSIENISITVYATQDTVESDSFDNQYDANASYLLANGQHFTSGTHTLSTGIKATAPHADALRVSGSNTRVIIEGGNFDGGEGGENTCIWARNGANVIINDGTFTVGKSADGLWNPVIYCTGGATVTINGGFFYPYYSDGFYYVLNQNNGNPGNFVVKGGTFVNYNPSTGDDSLGGNFVASGYKVVYETKANGDVWYTVVAE